LETEPAEILAISLSERGILLGSILETEQLQNAGMTNVSMFYDVMV
jgi:hypothetical protein